MDTLSNKHIETWSVYNAFALVIALIVAVVSKQLNILLIVFSISIIVLLFINKKKLLQ